MARPIKRARLVNLDTFEQVSTLEDYRLKELPDSEVYYVPSFISQELSEEWYSALLELDSCMFIPHRFKTPCTLTERLGYQPKLKVYGREVTQSRKIAAYSTDPDLILKYSGQTVDMKYQYPPVLRDIQDQVENRLGVKFNHVMLNLYEDGKVYIGTHRDNIENKVIASLSLGAQRTFTMIRDRKTPRTAKFPASGPSHEMPQGDKSPGSGHKRPRNTDDVQVACPEETISLNRKSWILAPGSLVVMQGETQKHWKHEIPKEPKVTRGRISLTFRQLISS